MFSLRNPGNFELFKLSQMKKQNKTKKHSLVKQALRLSKDIFSVFALLDRECIHWQKLRQQRKSKKHRSIVCRKKFLFSFFNLTIQKNVLNYPREVMYTRKQHFKF